MSGGNPNQHVPGGELPAGLSRGGVHSFDKSGLLKETAQRFGCRTLVETGLYQGHGSGMGIGAPIVRYVAVDWQAVNVEHARGLGFEARQGDSPAVLRELLTETLPAPVLFWLDAHALDADEGSPQVCPALGELDAIGASAYRDAAVILIDDLWGFGTVPGWPSVAALCEHAERCGWSYESHYGVMRCLSPSVRPV